MNADDLFHPYQTGYQSSNYLEVKIPDSKTKLTLWALRLAPLLALIIGAVMYLVQKEPLFLWIFAGVALLEFLILSFVTMPVAIKMENMGFELTSLSLAGSKQQYYLWNDVSHIHHKIIRTKNSKMLVYEAVMNSGKKIRFLSFDNFNKKSPYINSINEVLRQISYREVKPA